MVGSTCKSCKDFHEVLNDVIHYKTSCSTGCWCLSVYEVIINCQILNGYRMHVTSTVYFPSVLPIFFSLFILKSIQTQAFPLTFIVLYVRSLFASHHQTPYLGVAVRWFPSLPTRNSNKALLSASTERRGWWVSNSCDTFWVLSNTTPFLLLFQLSADGSAVLHSHVSFHQK